MSGNTRGRTLLSNLDVNIRVLNHAKYSLTPQGVHVKNRPEISPWQHNQQNRRDPPIKLHT